MLKVADEEWRILDGRLWVLAVAVTFINTADKPITLTSFVFENRDLRDRLGDRIGEKISHEAESELKRMTEPRAAELFAPDLVLSSLTPITKWVIAAALPLPEGGRPECLLRFEDTLGDTYDVYLDRRPIQRFRAWQLVPPKQSRETALTRPINCRLGPERPGTQNPHIHNIVRAVLTMNGYADSIGPSGLYGRGG